MNVLALGMVKHDGHNTTNRFLHLETNSILFPSEIRFARSPNGLHKRLDLPDGEELALPTIIKSIDLSDGEELTPPTKIKSRINKKPKTVVYSNDDQSDIEDVLLRNSDLIGQTSFLKLDDEGYVRRAKIVELNRKHNHDTGIEPTHIQICLSIDKGEYERVMAYHEIHHEIHNWSKTRKDNPTVWKLKRIASHLGYIQLEHSSYLGLAYSTTIEWKHGETTPDLLNITGADGSANYAIYTRNSHNLLDRHGRRLF
jgi:hypothetical protein